MDTEQINSLSKLKELLDAGVLTEEEFTREKNSILSQHKQDSATQSQTSVEHKVSPDFEDKPSVGLDILSFLMSIVGIILYFTTKDKYPIRAKSNLKWALIGLAVMVVYWIIELVVINLF